MFNRQLTDFGVHPLPGSILASVIFAGISIYLFKQTTFAPWIYVLMALGVTGCLNSSSRNEFLRSCFITHDYFAIRLAEHLLVVSPFLLFLLCKNYFFPAAVLLALSVVNTFIRLRPSMQFAFPTPFYNQPFEFIAGFRKTWLVITGCYALTIIGIAVNNLHLGIFALLLIFLLCMSFYSDTEPAFYVWIYSLTPTRFLLKKIKTACLQIAVLCLPIAIMLSVFFKTDIYLIAGAYCLGCVYLVAIVCAKYSALPQQMGLPQIILLAICIPIPFLLIIVIPYFYNQSLKKTARFLQ